MKKSESKKQQKRNVRVYELAKEMELSSKELIEELRGYGISIKSHMSTLDPETVELILAEREEPVTEDETPALAAKDEPVEPDVLQIQEGTTVGQLAEQLGQRATEIITHLMTMGIMAHINQSLDYDVLEKLADHYDFHPTKQPSLEERLIAQEEDHEEDLVPRAPVATVMGHVDHGKTSLLDAVRNTSVIDTEAGGITQHISAFSVDIGDKRVVFLDTPGHQAFTAMRARGAEVTDVVVLVVAADDGIMPQTVEALNHAKAGNVPVLVAINKIDLPNAKVDQVKQQFAEYDIVPEEWGGQNIFVEISAKNRIGIDNLLEMLLLEAEMLELKANPNRRAYGAVIEARLDRGRGAVATVLIQNGTLHIGDPFLAGNYDGRVRAMLNDRGEHVKEAGPATPVEVLGFNGVPEAGDRFHVVESESQARDLSTQKLADHRNAQLTPQARVTLEEVYRQIQEGDVKDLNLILKADVQGSIEALAGSIQELSVREIRIRILHKAVGGITEADVMLAAASNAVIIGFNVRPTPVAMAAAEAEGVEIRTGSVIYRIISDIRAAMEGMLEPETREEILGRATVRQVFRVPRLGSIAGSYVSSGRIVRNESLRVILDNRVIYEGIVHSLRRFKEDVREVQAGYECGIGMENFSDFKDNDILECYTQIQVARQLK